MSSSINVSNNKTIAKNTFFLYIRMGVSLIVSLYTSRVVINTLGIVDYGIFNIVAGVVSMFAFLNSSLTASIQRFYNYERGKYGKEGTKKVYKVAVVTQLFLAFLVFMLVEIVGLWYLHNKIVLPLERFDSAEILFQLSLVSLLLLIIQVPYSAAVVSFEKMNIFALVGISETLLRLAIVIVLPYVPYDKLIVYGCLGVLVSLLSLLSYFIYAKKNFSELIFDCKIDFSMLRDIFFFSIWNAFGAFATILKSQGVNIILNAFFGPVVNAARGVAYSIQSAMMGFVYNIYSAARPQLTESYAKGDYSRSISLMFSISKLCFILLYMMILPIGSEINCVLHLWLGDAVPNYTNIFTLMIFAIMLVDVLNTPVSMIMLATGVIVKFNIVSSIIGLLVLPLSYVVLKLGGSPVSVFIVSLLVSIIVQIVCLFIMRSVTGISMRSYLKNVVIPLLILVLLTCFFPLILFLIFNEGILRLFCSISFSIIFVGLVSYYFVLTMHERFLVRNFLKQLLNKVKS